MLARLPKPGALERRLRRPSWRLIQASQSRSPNLFSKPFSLRVRLEETGEIYRLPSCFGHTTVRELKEELDLMAGIPFHFQRLFYLDQGILMDDSTLGFHDIVPGGIVSMCIWHQDGWQELVLAALEGDASKLYCLGVTEDSLYRTPHSLRLRAEKYKEWIAARAFVALYVATHRGHFEAVRFLLENGASCLAKTPVGRTALHVAAAMGHVNCINILLEYGAPLTEKDLKGETPIEIANRLKRKQSMPAFFVYVVKLRIANLGCSQPILSSFTSTTLLKRAICKVSSLTSKSFECQHLFQEIQSGPNEKEEEVQSKTTIITVDRTLEVTCFPPPPHFTDEEIEAEKG